MPFFTNSPVACGRLSGLFQQGQKGRYKCVCTYSITNITCTYTVTTFEVRPIFLWWMPNYFLNPIFLCQSKPVSANSLPPLIWGKGMPPFTVAQVRSTTKPLIPQPPVKGREGDAGTAGEGASADISTPYSHTCTSTKMQGAVTVKELIGEGS